MSAKIKTILLTALTLVIMGGGFFLLSSGYLMDHYAQLERDNQTRLLQQVSKAVDRIAVNLRSMASDWALHGDTIRYLSGEIPSFPYENFTPTVLQRLAIDLVVITDGEGRVVFATEMDQSKGVITDPSRALESLVRQIKMAELASNDPAVHQNTLLTYDGKTFISAVKPVFLPSGIGPAKGALLFGLRIDDAVLDTIRVDAGITGLHFYDLTTARAKYSAVEPLMASGSSYSVDTSDPDQHIGLVVTRDLSGQPGGIFAAELEHSITNEGNLALRYLLGGMLGIGAAALLMNLLISNFLIFRPLAQLAVRVRNASNLDEQLQTLASKPTELDPISYPLETVLQSAMQSRQESLNRQNLYTQLFEQAREGFAILDPVHLVVLEANHEFSTLLDWDRKNFGEANFHDLLVKWLDRDTAAKFLAAEAEVVAGRARLREQEMHLADLARDLEISVSPIQIGNKRYLYAMLRDVTERKQLEQTLRQQVRETNLLNQVIAVTTSNLEPTSVFETVCRELAINLGLPQSWLAVFNDERTKLSIVADYSGRSIPTVIGTVFPLDHEQVITGNSIQNEPLRITPLDADQILDGLRDLMEKRGTESALLVPLVVREASIGWLALEENERRRFSEEEVRLAQNMAQAASRAYEVAMLNHDLQEELTKREQAEGALDRRKRSLEALVQVLMGLLGLDDSESLYESVLPVLGEVTRSERVAVFRLYPSLDADPYLRQMADWKPPEEKPVNLAVVDNFPITEEFEQIIDELQHGNPVSGQVEQFPAALRQPLVEQGIRSLLLLPLTVRNQLNGLLGFFSKSAERRWDDLEITTLQAAAASVSLTQDRIDTGEDLRQSEGRYRLVVENARDVIFQMDLTGRFTFVNPAWETITGIRIEDTIGYPFWKVAPEAMVQELGAGFRILRERVTDRYHQTMTIQNLHGKTIWLDAYIRIVQDAETSSPMIAGTMVDITSYKRIEYVLRHNEEALRSLYDITSSLSLPFEIKLKNMLRMGAQTFDLDHGVMGRIDGDSLELLYRYPETNGTDRVDLANTFIRETLRANEPLGIENVLMSDWANHPALTVSQFHSYLGTPVLVGNEVHGVLYFYSHHPRSSNFSLADKEFARLMAQWIGSEIERERYTRQLQDYYAEIARKSEELAVARDQALEASRLKSEFLATMSHEIRTPLNSVIGMSEMLMETSLSDDQDEFAHTIRESGKSLLTIINDILDFSKIEAGRMSLEAVDFALLPLLDSVLDMFAPAIQKKNIGLYSFISPNVPPVLVGDPIRLRQVLTNLVGNGVKFTDVGEVMVRVQLEERLGDRVRLLIKVADTGIGLSDLAKRRLFNPFTQADGSTTRKYGGTGLGLAITKSLVELMNGDIDVKSVEGIGSTFWFTAEFGVNVDEEKAASIRNPDLSQKHMLQIDGNPAQRRLMSAMIRAWGGAEPAAAWDVARAKELILEMSEQKRAVDLIIYDLEFLGEHLSEVHALVNNRQDKPPCWILLSSTNQREEAERLAKQAHGVVLFKPVRQSTFFDTLVSLCIYGEAPQVVYEELAVNQEPVKKSQELVAPSSGFQSGLILLAEDNPANQRLAVVQLKRLGYQAEVIPNGQVALNTYVENPDRYNVILMDCQMPIMDGFEATRQIRKAEIELGRHIPIVAMTANAMAGDRQACLDAGMDDYISKPVSLESLRQTLSRILDHEDVRSGDLEEKPAPVTRLSIDPDVIANLRELQDEGEPDFLNELIEIYLEDSLKLVSDLEVGVKARDHNKIKQSAHTLKGSSGNLGAMIFSRMCYEMEMAAKNNDSSAAEKQLPDLLGEYRKVREELENVKTGEKLA